ncbi:MAG: metalloenzyme [Deltaproteobacteria bacterium]|nr:metalloenzyme [Deltaproteobacteria bacterium]HCH66499.1 metalloenzyme [Deltaproteobacteria bacterium]
MDGLSVEQRPLPAPTARDVVVIVLDSCRFDSFAEAAPSVVRRLGRLEKRYSYATWTAPSHYNLLMGLLPHESPRGVHASTYYSRTFRMWSERFGVPDMLWTDMVPHLWLPRLLRRELGFLTRAMVSLPVLNEHTPLSGEFDSWMSMPTHNNFGAMVDALTFDDARPTFWLLNVGETHYPYAPAHEPASEWPRIHGVHGVFQRLSSGGLVHASEAPRSFSQDRLDALRRRQVDVVRHLDPLLHQLLDRLPPGTRVILTADHGELFGEAGFFGHGPIHHEKVLEVPFVEGQV